MFFKNYRKLNRSIYMIKLGMETQRDQFHFRSESSSENDRKTLLSLEKCLDYWIKEINKTIRWTDNHPEGDAAKQFDARELTMDEWQKWKKDPKRDPICQLYYNDFTPFWVLDPNEVNEVLYYAGKIKLFTKKPEKWQVNWK